MYFFPDISKLVIRNIVYKSYCFLIYLLYKQSTCWKISLAFKPYVAKLQNWWAEFQVSARNRWLRWESWLHWSLLITYLTFLELHRLICIIQIIINVSHRVLWELNEIMYIKPLEEGLASRKHLAYANHFSLLSLLDLPCGLSHL